MAVVILSGTLAFVPENTRRQTLDRSVGSEAAEVVVAPENQEKSRRFLQR